MPRAKVEKVPPQSEKDFQAQVVDLARALGWMVYHTHNSKHSAAGYPDLTMVRKGRVIWAELKSQKGTLTGVQRDWLSALPKGQSYLWRPSNWDEILAVLRGDAINII